MAEGYWEYIKIFFGYLFEVVKTFISLLAIIIKETFNVFKGMRGNR